MANLAYIQITRECNQRCIICSNPPSGWRNLTLARAKKLVDKYIKAEHDGLILSGGEPTVYPFLAEIISYCRIKKFPVRLISNGQKMADAKYLNSLVRAGLRHVGISIYSNNPKIQAQITRNDGALVNVEAALKNLIKAKIRIDICIAISKLNADHLSSVVRFILKKYPSITHFVFNNLDPTASRVKENPHTIPRLTDLEVELIKSLNLLVKHKKTCRVERIPLCYLPEFEYCSTETRKIVKKETRPIYFLDEKGFLLQEGFVHEKGRQCKICFLNDICAGLFQAGKYFDMKELYPVFVSKEEIKRKILADEK
jgi:MoaA/NifB/PqqE/SkfB family radical SAM enzyme